jgi:hypothetical protein
MPIDPTDLAKSIGALGSLDPDRGLAPTLQQITDAAKQLFAADGAGLLLVDADGQLRWASASDQTAQAVEDGHERLAQGPTTQVKGRLATQLQAALEHRWLIEQAKGMVMARERLDAQAAFERLRRAARSSSRRLADVAREVTAGKPLPLANRPQQRPSSWDQADRQDQPGSDS